MEDIELLVYSVPAEHALQVENCLETLRRKLDTSCERTILGCPNIRMDFVMYISGHTGFCSSKLVHVSLTQFIVLQLNLGLEVIFQVRVGVLPPISRYRETS